MLYPSPYALYCANPSFSGRPQTSPFQGYHPVPFLVAYLPDPSGAYATINGTPVCYMQIGHTSFGFPRLYDLLHVTDYPALATEVLYWPLANSANLYMALVLNAKTRATGSRMTSAVKPVS